MKSLMQIITKMQSGSVKGFTLVEVLVSMAIFVTTMSIGVLAVVTMDSAAKRVRTKDQAIQSAYFLMDSISRSVRMGSDFRCAEVSLANVSASSVGTCESTPSTTFSYTDQLGNRVSLKFVSDPTLGYGVLRRNIQTKNQSSFDPTKEINLHDSYVLKIEDADFVVAGEGNNDSTQPFVSIRLVAMYAYKGASYKVPLQVMLTQRMLDQEPQ